MKEFFSKLSNLDVNYINKSGLSALHLCAIYGRSEIAQFFISRNANIRNPKNSNTPIHYAVKWSMSNIGYLNSFT
ncbi:MAG: ankyrin repeat domain-containing protein [Sphingobacteriia bacterium]|nr:ankyrin repeat domain-containing protein [Sphingobacteriia bacterium]